MSPPRVDILIKWDLETIEYFLDSVPPHLEATAMVTTASNSEESWETVNLTKHDLAIAAYVMSLNTILYEINALVEEWLLCFATWVLPEEERISKKSMRQSRRLIVNAVEQYYEVSLATLPGWSVLEELKEKVNALKHRGGMLMPDYTQGIPVFKRVRDNEEKCKSYLEAARQFLDAIWSVVEKQA